MTSLWRNVIGSTKEEKLSGMWLGFSGLPRYFWKWRCQPGGEMLMRPGRDPSSPLRAV